MATYTPPPYFPQSSLSPPDKNRYRKFKLVMALVSVLLIVVLGAVGLGIWYLVKWLF
jgi:predicted nucleic acid-binding Zn ribbon protein